MTLDHLPWRLPSVEGTCSCDHRLLNQPSPNCWPNEQQPKNKSKAFLIGHHVQRYIKNQAL